MKLSFIVITLIAFILFLEFFFPYFMMYLPLKTHTYLNEEIKIMAQYSKSDYLPLNYMALIGDSYAAGQGDWYYGNYRHGRPDFHSAHIIYNKLGIDVISFGACGAGSLRGLVAEPISQYEFINFDKRFSLQPPRLIIIYFYEGNDLNNNLSDIQQRFKNHYDFKRVYDNDYFQDFILHAVHHDDYICKKTANLRIKNHLYFTKFIYRLVKQAINKKAVVKPVSEIKTRHYNGQVNRILINYEEVKLPDKIQSPALELNSNQIKLALYVFEQALIYLRNYFPESFIGIVYIPSPLSSYEIYSEKVSIETYHGDKNVYPAHIIRRRSDFISSEIKSISQRNNTSFIDSRPFIWKYSKNQALHGPKDWNHFNKQGYIALSEAVFQLLNTNLKQSFSKKRPSF